MVFLQPWESGGGSERREIERHKDLLSIDPAETDAPAGMGRPEASCVVLFFLSARLADGCPLDSQWP